MAENGRISDGENVTATEIAFGDEIEKEKVKRRTEGMDWKGNADTG